MGNCACSDFTDRTDQIQIPTRPNGSRLNFDYYKLEYATVLSQIPDYTNPDTRATLQRIGPYVYDNDDLEDADLPPPQAYLWKDSSVYIGQWKDGLMHGRGRLILTTGLEYEGYWKNGRPIGKVRCIFEDGHEDELFEEWIGDSIRTVEVPNVSGYLYENYRPMDEGSVTCQVCTNDSKFEGEFSYVAVNFKGTFKLLDGTIYKGEWKMDGRPGFGIIAWPDGRKYEGEFANGQMHGYGIYEWPDGKK